jgi:hypothetical protein
MRLVLVTTAEEAEAEAEVDLEVKDASDKRRSNFQDHNHILH